MASRSFSPSACPKWHIPEPPEHRVLVLQAIARDANAFDALVKMYKAPVMQLCMRMAGGNRATAEDLSQEIFMNLWRKIDTFRGESKFTTWFFRLAVNRILMEFRKKQPQSLDALMAPNEQGIRYEPAMEDPSLLTTAEREALERALSSLSPSELITFQIYFVEGCDHRESASALGVATSTTKARVHKLRAKLVQELAPFRQESRRAQPSLPH